MAKRKLDSLIKESRIRDREDLNDFAVSALPLPARPGHRAARKKVSACPCQRHVQTPCVSVHTCTVHTCTYVCTCTHPHSAHPHTRVYPRTPTQCTPAHTCVSAGTHTVHACTRVCIRAHLHTCVSAHTHTAHTCTHLHITALTHMQTCSPA